MSPVAPSTKEQIVLAGERLFAQYGVEGVSLRQIGTAVGASNNSAVQYHFGTKDRLVQAIFEYRLPALQRRRDELMTGLGQSSLRDLLRCQVLPVMEQANQHESHYLTFVNTLRQHGETDTFKRVPAEFIEPARTLARLMDARLDHLPGGLGRYRVSRAMSLLLQAAADREQANAAGRATLSLSLEIADLLDCLTGLLNTPASPEVVTGTRRSRGLDLPFLSFF